MSKLMLVQRCARFLLEFGVHKDKKLTFYPTTYVKCEFDLDINATTTLEEIVGMERSALSRFIRPAEEELGDFIVYRD